MTLFSKKVDLTNTAASIALVASFASNAATKVELPEFDGISAFQPETKFTCNTDGKTATIDLRPLSEGKAPTRSVLYLDTQDRDPDPVTPGNQDNPNNRATLFMNTKNCSNVIAPQDDERGQHLFEGTKYSNDFGIFDARYSLVIGDRNSDTPDNDRVFINGTGADISFEDRGSEISVSFKNANGKSSRVNMKRIEQVCATDTSYMVLGNKAADVVDIGVPCTPGFGTKPAFTFN